MSYTNLNYHIVFSTKNHGSYLDNSQMNRLFEYIGGITNNLKATLLLVGGTTDHVHIAVRLHPELSITEFIRTVKTNSSKWVHDTFSAEFTWQEGYSAFSVSQSIIGKVIEYIQGQKEHHKKLTFKEELKSFLEKHNIEYNEKYL
ncbi:MAG: IS200/IS605 family transposase [Planctomycetota bacterium]